MADSDFASASKSLEDALEIMEKHDRLEFAVIVLHHLAKLGVKMALTSSDESAATSDITWLKLLEEKAVSDHLPGILGQAYLLKAKLAIGYDDNETLQESIRRSIPPCFSWTLRHNQTLILDHTRLFQRDYFSTQTSFRGTLFRVRTLWFFT